MIRSLCGEVLSATNTSVILDVGGLGLEILCSRGALALCSPGNSARLTTYLQISEAGAFLFGFANETERELFLKIISIKGIGGRTAMTILSVLSADEIIRAVSLADVNTFERVRGIGKKTAARLCFELKSLISREFTSALPVGLSASVSRVSDTVVDALRSLGFDQADAAAALDLVRAALGEDFEKLDEEKLLKAALKELHQGHRS
jgi:Holliday junction DNA helicase RuvA